ncbi:hypothetical protein BREVNS_0037 [Brevinematales bacterium NS]|nr:hypothetical protein BREVNS_0037 [Brevinematales bacterium NS]
MQTPLYKNNRYYKEKNLKKANGETKGSVLGFCEEEIFFFRILLKIHLYATINYM